MTGWRLVLAVAAGLIIGALVLALDVFLQPGQGRVRGGGLRAQRSM